MKKAILILLVTLCALALIALGSSATYALMSRATAVPTAVPTSVPTTIPAAVPTAIPTPIPTRVPAAVPTVIPSPTTNATAVPSPTFSPTVIPTKAPTGTAVPAAKATGMPSAGSTVAYIEWLGRSLATAQASLVKVLALLAEPNMASASWQSSINAAFDPFIGLDKDARATTPPVRYATFHKYLTDAYRHYNLAGFQMSVGILQTNGSMSTGNLGVTFAVLVSQEMADGDADITRAAEELKRLQ